MNGQWIGAGTGGYHSHVCYVVPPHILDSIIRRGDERQRDRALRTLEFDQVVRSARIGLSAAWSGVGRAATRVRRETAPWLTPRTTPKKRTIYDARHKQRLPGVVVREEGEGATGDLEVDEAYAGLGDTFDFYLDAYGRDSIDDRGMPLIGSVHYGKNYDNAFWNGRQMVFGDGDREQFNRFTISVDVIGHELTHGVTEREAGLIYWSQAGALNESVSDVFGSLVKQYVNSQKVDEADWLIGEGLFTDQVNGVALRSMKAPGTAYDDPVLGKDPQPAHMDDYDPTFQDNRGVHINSGIPNHAFYLAATNIGGFGWEVAGLIWYQTLLSPQLRPNAQFSTFARLTVVTAQQLFPESDDQALAVQEAWAEVGIEV